MKTGIVFTIGDPNGIGAEIILKIYNRTNYFLKYKLKVITPRSVIDFYSDLLNLKPLPPSLLIEIPEPANFKIQPGVINKNAGKISGDAVLKAVELYKNNLCKGLVTMPISKKSLKSAGFDFPGHTEFLMKLMNKKSNAMIMYHKELISMPITTHIPVSKICRQINSGLLISKINLLVDFIRQVKKVENPKIAVLSLNPHSGENGEIGKEEIEIINPAVDSLNKQGFNIQGAFSSDGFFGNLLYKSFDGVVGMYHDQIMIPFKLLSKSHGVNFTAGIDLIRTSPAHGTAFDIAGQNIAKILSSVQALKLAVKLVTLPLKKIS